MKGDRTGLGEHRGSGLVQTNEPEMIAPASVQEEVSRRMRFEPEAEAPQQLRRGDVLRPNVRLDAVEIEPAIVEATLGCLIKDRHDLRELKAADIAALVKTASAEGARP